MGLRYQALFAGEGRAHIEPRSVHQLAGTLRWGIIPQLELGFEGSLIIFHQANSDDAEVAAGDIGISLLGRFLHTRHHLLGVYLSLDFPTGPSDVDILPPFWADGTWDFQALLLYELAITPNIRLVLDMGYVHHGTRDPAGALPTFDVPDAFRWDLGSAFHIGRDVLLFLELHGRHYFQEDLTPFWVDNQHLLAVAPGVRIETIPQLVLEIGLGFGLTREAREIYLVRLLVGLTYEFNIY
jgi:hypothetical protein